MTMPNRLAAVLDDMWNLLKLLFLTVIMYLSPIKMFVHLVALLIVLDMVTGIIGAWKAGEKITAKRMSTTVLKIILYSIAIIATYLVQLIANEGVGFVRICALIIAATELKSIYENIGKMLGGDLFKLIWLTIKGKVDDVVTALPGKTKTENGENSIESGCGQG